MLNDTSDIILDKTHPADFHLEHERQEKKNCHFGTTDDENGKNKENEHHSTLLFQFLSYEQLMSRPSLGDDGNLAPELLRLWKNNSSRVLDKPFPYSKTSTSINNRNEENKDKESSRELDQSIEIARENASFLSQNEEQELVEVITEGQQSQTMADESNALESSQPYNNDFLPPEDEDDLDIAATSQQVDAMELEDGTSIIIDGDVEDDNETGRSQVEITGLGEINSMQNPMAEYDVASSSTRSSVGGLSLGLVNDFESDFAVNETSETNDDNLRQEAGSDLISSNTKWHKHTITVLRMLQRNISSGNTATKSESGMGQDDEKPRHLSYHKLSKRCTRRTGAGVFFELLQLKTWDFIELNQNDSYGDIIISPGVRFHESPPSG